MRLSNRPPAYPPAADRLRVPARSAGVCGPLVAAKLACGALTQLAVDEGQQRLLSVRIPGRPRLEQTRHLSRRGFGSSAHRRPISVVTQRRQILRVKGWGILSALPADSGASAWPVKALMKAFRRHRSSALAPCSARSLYAWRPPLPLPRRRKQPVPASGRSNFTAAGCCRPIRPAER